MKSKKNKEGWNIWSVFELITVFVFLIIIFFVGNNLKNNQEYLEDRIKVIEVSGMDSKETITISEPSQVFISGLRAEATFTKISNPQEIYLSGMDTKAFLCKEIHNPKIYASGLRSEAVYLSC